MAEYTTAFAVLAAHDLARARAWYTDKLGLQPVLSLEGMDTEVYVIGGAQVMLYQTPSAGTAKNTSLGIVVADLRGTMAELRSRGVVFEDYDMQDGPKTIDGIAADETGGAAAWFADSEGNIINLVQLPPGFPLP